MRVVTTALTHYLQLLRQIDANAWGTVMAPAAARYERTRWTVCMRGNSGRMNRAQSASRQRRLYLLTCRLRAMEDVQTQLELDLRFNSRFAMASPWIDEERDGGLLMHADSDK